MHECRAGRARRIEEGNLLRLDVAVELFDALLGAGEIVAVPAAPRLPDVGAKPSHPSFVRPSYTSTPFSRRNAASSATAILALTNSSRYSLVSESTYQPFFSHTKLLKCHPTHHLPLLIPFPPQLSSSAPSKQAFPHNLH